MIILTHNIVGSQYDTFNITGDMNYEFFIRNEVWLYHNAPFHGGCSWSLHLRYCITSSKVVKGHWRSFKLVEGHWNSLKLVEGHWSTFKLVEDHWISFKLVEVHWKSFKLVEVTEGGLSSLKVTEGRLSSLNVTEIRWSSLKVTESRWVDIYYSGHRLLGPLWNQVRVVLVISGPSHFFFMELRRSLQIKIR